MSGRGVARASSLFLSLSLLVAAGCCHEQRPTVLPPVQNQEQKIAALDTQLKMAESAGWNGEQERRFSATMATLPMDVRIDYAHRLARALTYGQIKVRPPAPPPDDAPVCACGGNSCGVATTASPPPDTTNTPPPPATTNVPPPVKTNVPPPVKTVPGRGERNIK